MEQTFIMVKPDGVKRGLVGEVIGRFERKGYRICQMRMLVITPTLAEKHYGEHMGKGFYPDLVEFITSGQVVAFVLEGDNVIEVVRKMAGATNAAKAEAGTIRGDLSHSNQQNIMHASDSLASADREIKLFFGNC